MVNSSQELAAHLFDLEQQLLEPSTRRDSTALTSLLAEDFREFGSSERVRLATEAQLTDVVGKAVARKLRAFYESKPLLPILQ